VLELSKINFQSTNCRLPESSALGLEPPRPLPCCTTDLTLGASAPIERICYILNNVRFDNRGNVKALITSKINTDFSSCDFYKNEQDFLKKVLSTSTEKYDWPNM